MNIMQSTIEKLLYYLLALVFIASLVSLGFVIREDQQVTKILNNHSQTIARVAIQTKTLENNQYNNGTALETFIREGLVCIAINPLPPTATSAQIQAIANKCFPNTAEIK